jgi:hypothetical protein
MDSDTKNLDKKQNMLTKQYNLTEITINKSSTNKKILITNPCQS